MTRAREPFLDIVIEAGTGKALELRRGQVLRIEQIEGGQCADFNCFNLHDYKEHLSTGLTRRAHGLLPSTGDLLWSAPPRERPMAAIVADTLGTNDTLWPRCSGGWYELRFGYEIHTNCHDIQAEAQREYGLTPDDVHDSFNLFTNAGVTTAGRPFMANSTAAKGDYVEFLALIDLLAVPNVCGADIMPGNNFELRPLRLAIFESSTEDIEAWTLRRELQPLRNQRTPADFKVRKIKADRELRRDPDYVPDFPNVPIAVEDIEVLLDGAERELLDRLTRQGELGSSDGEVLRAVLHNWWIERFLETPEQYDTARRRP